MTKPYPYQKQATLKVEEFDGRALISAEMGLGKSLMSLLWAKWNPSARPIIVVCPASLKENWERECSKHFDMPSEILYGTKPKKGGFKTLCPVTVINYEILKPWMEYLRGLEPKLIIIDEAQAISNPSSLRSKQVKALCKDVPHVLALSGTPLMNRPIELFPILNLLRPDVYSNYRQFGNRYCGPKLTPWGLKYPGATNLGELNKRLKKDLMIRILKKDVLHQLPPKRMIVVPLEIHPRQEYDRAVKDFLRWLSEKSLAKAKKAAKAEQMTKIIYIKKLIAELKLKSVIGWIDSFLRESDGKLIFFGIHKEFLNTLHKHYKQNSLLITGDVPPKHRLEITDRFQIDNRIRLMFGNIKAAGVGLNMTAASAVAHGEFHWTPGAHAQATDRAHRIGQTRVVDVYWLVGRDTIDEKHCQIIQKKQRDLEAVLDGKGRGEAMDIFDLLEAELKRNQKDKRRG